MFFKQIFLAIFIFTNATLVFADQLIVEPDDGRTPLLNSIQNAHSSIDLVMYGFTDFAFADALAKARQQGKQVHVLLESTPYRTENENEAVIQDLQKFHVPLVYPDDNFKLTHQKTFIFDHHDALVMTFNLTHSTFKNQRNFAVKIDDQQEVDEIENVFHADSMHRTIHPHNPNLVWSPDNSREKIADLINNANNEILIYAQDISDYKTIGLLGKAARRGVKIKMLLSLSPEKRASKKIQFLTKSGIHIHILKGLYVHAKVMIVDRQKAMVGSINLTKPSIDDNRELSVITKDPEVVNKLIATFDRDWERKTALAHSNQIFSPTFINSIMKLVKHYFN